MNPIKSAVTRLSARSRQKRAGLFKNTFVLDENTRILDLGSESGANIAAVIRGTQIRKENVFIADIEQSALSKGAKDYGFIPVFIDESGQLDFADQYFDIVYCSSVIEHVTIPKDRVWTERSGRRFRGESLKRQREFANEIKRLGKQYFVQTPYRHFLIKSHTWLPFVAWLPRRMLLPVLRLSNRFWVKTTSPDWHLLNKKEMRGLFGDAEFWEEKAFCLTKSIVAIKCNKQ